MEITRETIKSAIDKIGAHLSPQARQMIEEAAVKTVEQQMPATEVMGFTPVMMEQLYQLAFNQFRGGRYADALKLFDFLIRLDCFEYRFVFGLAACHHYLKHYQDAAGYYLFSQQLDPLNPIPHFHLYDCFMKLNQPLPALQAIQETVQLAKLNSKYQQLGAKAELECNHLISSLPVYLKEKFGASAGKKAEASKERVS